MQAEKLAYADLAEIRAIEEVPVEDRMPGTTVYGMLHATAERLPHKAAVSFQIKSGPRDRAETLDWKTLHSQVMRLSNLLRSRGVGEGDAVAYLLPNSNETVITLLASITTGIAAPINPLLEVEQIAGILREVGAKALVTLAPFPKSDIAQKAHAAAALVPEVELILEVDLVRYLTPPLSWVVPFLRPRVERAPTAETLAFHAAVAAQPGDRLIFEPNPDLDRVAANLHTGGTTGSPKVAQHTQRGMVYNGAMPALGLLGEDDVLICPLPFFHVLACYPVLMSCLATGAHVVLPTPAGYRGDGVMDNFWALIERWGVTFMVMVPTAASALMQREVKHDLSTLKFALCGSAPMPVELFRRFEAACGVKILEGYGMTEATCLVSINPVAGERKIGSVGLPIPYTDVKILDCDLSGDVRREMDVDEIGEICLRNPGVFPGYREAERNYGLFSAPGGYLRTGDLGRIDADGYVWITGRSKDLIIRGGHNLDPALIEEALMGHHDVAFCGAIGQPDPVAGELPCAYVEIRHGAAVTEAELLDYAKAHITERAAVPKHLEIVADLPKTAVGKVFKPELRKRAIARVFREALAADGLTAAGVEVIEDKSRGLVARIRAKEGRDAVAKTLEQFAVPWEMQE